MKKHLKPILFSTSAGLLAGAATSLLFCETSRAQSLSQGVIDQFNSTVGPKVEAADVLGGDVGLTGGRFLATGNSAFSTDIKISKFGGGGDVGDPKPLGNLGVGWQPRLQGSMGYLDGKKHFNEGIQNGDESELKTFAIQFGGGARFWFDDHFSLAPTVMGMYGHTKNDYDVSSPFAHQYADQAAKLGIIDWNVDTWTIRPAINGQYVYTLGRTIFTLASDFTYYHTQSFEASSSYLHINGDSETWKNTIDVDIPLGKQLFGHELRTGGYFARTEFYNNIQQGLNTDHLYDFHGRIVLDFLGQLWKVQWIGLGASYMWGSNFDGYSIGADIAFRF